MRKDESKRLPKNGAPPGAHVYDPNGAMAKRLRWKASSERKRKDDRAKENLFTERIKQDILKGETTAKIIEKFFSEYKGVFYELDDKTAKTLMERMIGRLKTEMINEMRNSIRESDDLESDIMYLISEGKNEDEIVQMLLTFFEKDEFYIRERIKELESKMEELWNHYNETFLDKRGILNVPMAKSNFDKILQFEDEYKILDRSGCKTSILNVDNGIIPNGIAILCKYFKMKNEKMKEAEKNPNRYSSNFRKSVKVPRSRWSQYR